MIEKVVDTLVSKQFISGTIQKEDIAIYQYGYTLMLESIVNILLSMLIAGFLEEIKAFLFFFVLFVPLRSFCGGYHAKKAWQCVVLSNIAVSVSILLSNILAHVAFPSGLYIFGDLILSGVIILLAPVENRNKKLDNNEKKFYKKCAALIVIIELVAGMYILFVGNKKMSYLLLLVHVIQLVSQLVVIVNKSRK